MYCLVSVNLWKCGLCLKLTVTYMIGDNTEHELEWKKLGKRISTLTQRHNDKYNFELC